MPNTSIPHPAPRRRTAWRLALLAAIGLVLALATLFCAHISRQWGDRPTSLRLSALEQSGPLDLPFGAAERWLYFPMYEGDTAHAVDLGALRWRSDQLLASATRYPRHGGEDWPEQLYQTAHFEYVTRLIDCQSGVFADLTEALTDDSGKPLIERPMALRHNNPRRAGGGGEEWPDRSEIGMACLAAANPELLPARRQQAGITPAPLTYLPTMAILQEDSQALLEQHEFAPDLAAITASTTAATPRDVLAAVALQRAQWRRNRYGPGTPQETPFPWPHEAEALARVEQAVNRQYLRFGQRTAPILHLLEGGFYTLQVMPRTDIHPPPEGVDAYDDEQIDTVMGHCGIEMQVLSGHHWEDPQGRQVAEQQPDRTAMLQSLEPIWYNANPCPDIAEATATGAGDADAAAHPRLRLQPPLTIHAAPAAIAYAEPLPRHRPENASADTPAVADAARAILSQREETRR
ncbi:hypothetical protein [Corticibacter populi]|nr:hypothetical protein [Corticibacter populi]RZS31903.1 hypothetical protein EV687_2583 [Corticibacter populi]